MIEPIKAGDDCLVTAGLGRHKSPNRGLIVKVVSLQGEHSQHGRIWRCTNPEIKQMTDVGGYVTVGWGDFAAAWLEKQPPAADGSRATKVEKALTA